MNALEIKNLSVSFLMYDKGIKKKGAQGHLRFEHKHKAR